MLFSAMWASPQQFPDLLAKSLCLCPVSHFLIIIIIIIIIIGSSRSLSANDDYHDFQTNSFPTFPGFQKSVLGLQKKENHQNLILEMMES